MEKGVIELTDQNFEEMVKNSKGLILVDFFADWCNPCKMLEPIIDELASEYSGKIKFGKMNIEKNPKIPPQFHVMSLPTIIIFKNGEIAEHITRGVDKTSLKDKIEKALK
jgi:thioredoxin 1